MSKDTAVMEVESVIDVAKSELNLTPPFTYRMVRRDGKPVYYIQDSKGTFICSIFTEPKTKLIVHALNHAYNFEGVMP